MNDLSKLIPTALEGERLDRVVAILADVSRGMASEAVKGGSVWLDGEPVLKGSFRVSAGQEFHAILNFSQTKTFPKAEPKVEIPILYVDEHVIVINKPSGLVVHPGAGNESGTLVNGLLATFPDIWDVGSLARPGIVHRLDRDTSGLMVAARSQMAYENLVEQLSSRSVSRRYLALTWGHFGSEEGVIEAPIGRSPKDRTRMAVVSTGRESLTSYRVLKSWESPEVSLISVVIKTGRTHQIRVHLSAIGNPIVADKSYGKKSTLQTLERPFLHAEFLGFKHPEDGRPLEFETSLPDDLFAVLKQLGDSNI